MWRRMWRASAMRYSAQTRTHHHRRTQYSVLVEKKHETFHLISSSVKLHNDNGGSSSNNRGHRVCHLFGERLELESAGKLRGLVKTLVKIRHFGRWMEGSAKNVRGRNRKKSEQHEGHDAKVTREMWFRLVHVDPFDIHYRTRHGRNSEIRLGNRRQNFFAETIQSCAEDTEH